MQFQGMLIWIQQTNCEKTTVRFNDACDIYECMYLCSCYYRYVALAYFTF